MHDGRPIVLDFHDVESDGVILLALGSFRPPILLLQRDENDFAIVVVFRRRERVLRVLQESLFVVRTTAGPLC